MRRQKTAALFPEASSCDRRTCASVCIPIRSYPRVATVAGGDPTIHGGGRADCIVVAAVKERMRQHLSTLVDDLDPGQYPRAS